MRILVAAATAAELEPLLGLLNAPPVRNRLVAHSYRHHQLDLLTTGVGMVATAAGCATALARAEYGFALNLGLCGSFDRSLQPGAVVHVVEDRLAELGAEDGDRFLTLAELGLAADGARPDVDVVVNRHPIDSAALRRLPAVTAITVNTVHGNERTIAAVVARFRPQIETMEGAAFMYACRLHEVPFVQLRAVSNVVERRNRGAWRVAEALEALSRTARAVIADL
jgi:futalosine hydrolase